MPNESEQKHRHLVVEGVTQTEAYRSPQQGGGRPKVPLRDREHHGAELRRQLDAVKLDSELARKAQQESAMEDGLGLQVEFESFPDVELAFESLAREGAGIELHNVRHEGNRTCATVFVPDGKLAHFEKLIGEYLARKTDRNGRPRDNRTLIDALRSIRTATLHALWTDDSDLFPSNAADPLWWEVWLPVRGNREASVAAFRGRAHALSMRVARGELRFPERTVLLVYASPEQLQRSVLTLNSIAELRRPKETAEFFDSIPANEQAAWLEDLLSRTRFAEGDAVPHVCLLDTGVNSGHPLLAPALSTVDLHTVHPDWGVEDQVGHGTNMGGLALVGDLTAALDSREPLVLTHRLESVKLLPHDGANSNDPEHHGYLTTEAVARPEVSAPLRPRVFAMAVTARDNRDRGRPSAWSAALDEVASDALGYGANPRLLVVAAGNVEDPNAWLAYPESNDTDGIHDPGQAWNALTVGACTDLIRITESDGADYVPIARSGGLSPFSSTSVKWPDHWPLKPDIVMEGGNAARDKLGAVWLPSLSLLTTHHQPAERLCTTANATSAATMLVSRMSAQVMAVYPNLWPETDRALIVHSAEWTPAMRAGFLPTSRTPSKRDYRNLVRRCGFGVPDLERALWSLANSLTLVVQERLHPFKREHGKEPALRDMHVHSLPWPKDALETLGAIDVEMRVTLSYFIEPNPSQRGNARGVSRYRYPSHGLRFDVKRPHESLPAFRARVNAAARDEEEDGKDSDDDSGWVLGKRIRHRGSLHSDIWRGSAAELASRACVAVYPALGWWKTRPSLERYDREVRYALVVSIKAPAIEVDLYTPVANQIGVPVVVET